MVFLTLHISFNSLKFLHTEHLKYSGTSLRPAILHNLFNLVFYSSNRFNFFQNEKIRSFEFMYILLNSFHETIRYFIQDTINNYWLFTEFQNSSNFIKTFSIRYFHNFINRYSIKFNYVTNFIIPF